MVRKRAGQFYDDGTMSFGEHIEELRKHLLRAGAGVLAALCVTAFFGNYVVKGLTRPLEGQLKGYHEVKLERTGKEYVAEQDALEPEARDQVRLPLELSPASLRALAAALGAKLPANPVALSLETTVEGRALAPQLGTMLAKINRPWSIKTLSAQEPMVMYFKAAVGAALVLSCPWVIAQLYAFVAVGLYAHERRFLRMTVPFAVLLFLLGVAFCWFVMMPVMARFLLGVNTWMDLDPDIRLNEWVGFCVMLMLVFGIAFQLPLLMVVTERVGLLSYETFAAKRRYAFFGIVVFSAVATPTPDPFNLALLAGPLYGLYEVGLLALRLLRRRTTADTAADLDDDLGEDLFAQPVR